MASDSDLAARKALLAELSQPLPAEAIERSLGKATGRGYDTVGYKYQYIVDRINAVMGLGGWRSCAQVEAKTFSRASGRAAYEATCSVVLELGSWIDGKWTPVAQAQAYGGHVATLESDAKKGAHTNALKKAAAMLGVGAGAYRGSLDDDHRPEEPVAEPSELVAQEAAFRRLIAESKDRAALRALKPDLEAWLQGDITHPVYALALARYEELPK